VSMRESAARHRAKPGSGWVQWLLRGGAALVLLVLTFAFGVLVGQKWARPADPPVPIAAEPAKKPATASGPRRSGLTEPAAERPPQEKLTFYQTLTAPLGSAPAGSKVDLGAKPDASKVHPVAERAPVAMPPPRADKAATTPERPAAARGGDVRPGDWAVQVGAFKDRDQAESVRKPLAAAGLDAYLIAATAPDGQTSYKVRLGNFKTREEAARLAARVRQERSLTAFVTPR